MKLITVIILSFVISQAGNLFAQNETPEKNISEKIVEDFNHFVFAGSSLASSPFHYSGNDFLALGSVAGGTAVLFSIDKNVRSFSQLKKTIFNNKLFITDKYYGSGYTLLIPGGLYAYGLIAGDSGIRKLGLHVSEALIYSGLIATVLKAATGRRRPYAGDSQFFFKPLQISNDELLSLPSGHTTVAFAVSTVMADHLDNSYWKIFWYGAAGWVAASRVYNNAHWASDVFLGSAIGYFTGSFITNLDKKKENKEELTFMPYFSLQQVGVVINF
ncbi:MAG: phosphatase PAP2 family protein [Ignavibacteriaceae bacterium]|nr:phosphatase PAP2 family protein [Ignavibacteriaceae bacterium]